MRRSLVLALPLLLIGGSDEPTRAAELKLCGRSAKSATQLYFDVARQFDASVLRADARQTIIEVPSSGELWSFVVQPVTATLCRRSADPGSVEAACDGPADLCATVVRNLTADPRAEP